MTPYSETLIDAIVAALAAISTGGGNSFTPAVTERFDRINSTKGTLPNIQVARGALNYSREQNAGNWVIDLDVDVQCAILPSATASDKAINLAFGDIADAVIQLDWQALKANLARIESIAYEEIDEEDPEVGIVVSFTVQYKLDFEDITLVVDPM